MTDTPDLDDIDLDLEADLDRAETMLSLRVERRRYGKPVTLVEGFADGTDLASLASRLKRAVGTGGTVTDGRIELQGEHGDRLAALLAEEGYAVE